MSELTVYLPPEMEPYKGDLEFFVATMVRKLHVNRHKGTGSDLHPGRMLVLLEEELDEAVKARHQSGQFEFGVECIDIANFAFLAARGAWQMTREEYDQSRRENDGNS
jgi:hypothetical protein